MQLGENADVVEHLGELLKRGLRGSLKTGKPGHWCTVC